MWPWRQAARPLSGQGDMTHTHDAMESRGWPLIRAGALGSASFLTGRGGCADVVREERFVWALG